MRTSLLAFKIAISGFIIPFLVVYNPVMVLEPESAASAIGSLVAIPVGMTAFAMALFNCGLTVFRYYEWLLSVGCAVFMLGYVMFRQFDDISLEYPMLAAGCITFVVLLMLQIKRKRVEGEGSRRVSPVAA